MPPSMSSTSTSQSQNISQMSMAQQRISAAQQQMRQPMTGYDPNIAQPSTSMPPGSYNIQQGQQQLMAGPPPSQQQFASYQQFILLTLFYFIKFKDIQDKPCMGDQILLE